MGTSVREEGVQTRPGNRSKGRAVRATAPPAPVLPTTPGVAPAPASIRSSAPPQPSHVLPPTAPDPGDRREIRVFVSSTFRDMQKERGLLMKKVFPELRRLCDERFVAFTEVDLRWGITQEQATEGKVLPICLEEIERSRPYFISLLGERYGWIPNTVPQDVLAKEPWLQEHVGGRISVTELEILHGVLNNPKMAVHAFFHFRNPAYIATLPESEQREMIERDIPDDIATLGQAQAASRTQERKDKLRNLKARIRQSGLPLHDNYPNPEALAGTVRQQFLDLIDRLYPKDQVSNPLDQEAIGHRAYARRKLLAYVDRPIHSQALRSSVEAPPTGQGLVVTGDSGGGKTALLAAWVTKTCQDYPDHFVFEHYFGATPDSAGVDGFLGRLLGELKRLADLREEIPSTPEKMREALPLWLAQAVGRRPIVLVLDALNQIQGDEADRRLVWLPRSFPAHVRLIASCLPGLALAALRERGWAQHRLPLADVAERGQMIDSFLRVYRKELGQKLRDQIVSAPGSANPLFLRTVLEELRQFGSFEKLHEQVGEYLKATTPEALFRHVIRRWQEDFHAGRDVVSRSLRHLWASRQGLSDGEWLDLLADDQGPMDRQTWRPLLLAMEPHLVRRGSLWAFGHDFLRQAVEIELIPTDERRQQAHRALANYFEQQPTGRRKAVELPWQLREGGDKERLPVYLLDIPLFRLIHGRDQNELMGYWVWLGQERTMGQPYLQTFDRWAADKGQTPEVGDAANQLGLFLHDVALYPEAESLIRRGLAICEASDDKEHPDVAIRLIFNLSALLRATNRLSEAEELMRRMVEILGENHPAHAGALNNLAQLLQATNRLSEAEPLMRRVVEIFEKSLGGDHPNVATALNNLGALLQDTNRPSEAEPLYQRALAIDEVSYGKEHVNVARDLSHLAGLLQATNRLSEAEPLMRRALAINETSYGKEHPNVAISLNNLGRLLQAMNRLSEAESLYWQALAIDEVSCGKEHLNVARDLNHLTGLLQAMNRLSEAEPLMRRALAIDEVSCGKEHLNVATDLNNLALSLQAMNRLSEAEPLMRRALAIYEVRYDKEHPDVAICLNNLGRLLQAMNRLSEAEPLLQRMLEIFVRFTRATGHPHPHMLGALSSYAALLQAMGYSRDQILAKLRKIWVPRQ